MRDIVYVDNAATTQTEKDAVDEMLPFFSKYYANPMSYAHSSLALKACDAITLARNRVARLINAEEGEIYFTSGGSEADNWAIKGICSAHRAEGRHIITSSIEHKAILKSAEDMKKIGFSLTILKVAKNGMIDPDLVRRSIMPDTILVSIMHANNEIGTIEPIAEIAKICKERGVIFHSDIVQSVPHKKIDINALGVDIASIAAHKFYGPKGVGALYIKNGIKIDPFLHAGGQEKSLRGSTHNVPGIVGMGKAAELLMEKMSIDNERITYLSNKLKASIFSQINDVRFNGHSTNRIIGNLSFTFKDVPSENIILMLNQEGIIAAGGSACNSTSDKMSHVLIATGDDWAYKFGALRISIGRFNTEEEIERLARILPEIIFKLRKLAV